MRAVLIVSGLFIAIFGGVFAYYAASGSGHEYDLKLVLPIDARQMPKPIAPPPVRFLPVEEAQAAPPVGRVEAGSQPVIPRRPPVQFEGPGAASESGRR
jgi:hypothetical protein